ncbi:hypothetical protein ACJJTC_001098 [Scirpophaga incertulas]
MGTDLSPVPAVLVVVEQVEEPTIEERLLQLGQGLLFVFDAEVTGDGAAADGALVQFCCGAHTMGRGGEGDSRRQRAQRQACRQGSSARDSGCAVHTQHSASACAPPAYSASER